MAGASSASVDLSLTAGLPYNRRIRVTDGANLWPTVDSFEIRSQIRSSKHGLSLLVADLVPFLTASIDGTDIVVDIEMTGADTRTMSKGYYDIILSDPGTTDARALSIVSGKVKIGNLITAASDV